MVRRSAAATLLLLAACHSNAWAQQGLEPVYEQPHWFVGYVANAPQMLLGGTVAALPAALGGWGLYADAKFGTESPAGDDYFVSDVSYEQALNVRLDTFSQFESYWRSFNLAVVRAFREDLIVYLGGGMAEERVFAEFFDETRELGNLGYYLVEDGASRAWYPNAMGGMYFRIMEHVALQFGAESTPVGLTVGVIAVF